MKKLIVIFLLPILFVNVCISQKQLKIEQVFTDRNVYPKRLVGLKPHFSQNFFTFINDNGDLVKIDAKGKETTFLKTSDVANATKKLGIFGESAIYSYEWTSEDELSFINDSILILFNTKTKDAEIKIKWNPKGENIALSPKKNAVAYTIENNLYLSENGKQKAITAERNKGVVCGKVVHRNEFGIEKGIFWSPQANKIAFYRMDETMVADYPLVNINTRIAELKNTKYPMAGMTSHEVTLGVYDLQNQKTIFLKTGEPKDQYLTNISWSPDDKFIFIGVLNRDQNHLKWNKYDANTGDFIKTIFEEKNDKYVEPLTPLVFVPNKSDEFIWQSQRDGFNHLYLFNTEGKLIKQITKGNWIVTEFGNFNKNGDEIWIMATKESPIESHAYIVNLKNGKVEKITSESGTHRVSLTNNFSLMSDYYSSITMASSYSIKTTNGKNIKTLLNDKNPLNDYDVPKPELITLKANDGTLLYGRLLKPIGFDSTKKYPIIIYVYGGPHAQLVTNSWTGGAGLAMYNFATHGYAVFTLDNRGSANRGFDFESAIFRNCGSVEVEDQMIGVNWLKKQSWVDQSHIGINGWSYGGFMTISLMLKNPGIFKAAVAGGPVIDWKYYEVMYGERYMDTPETNPEGYKNSALTNYAKNLEGRLLIIQGYQDATVVPQHCLSFLEASIKAGKIVDFFMYPNHEHNIRGKDAIHLYKTITQYFDDHLK